MHAHNITHIYKYMYILYTCWYQNTTTVGGGGGVCFDGGTREDRGLLEHFPVLSLVRCTIISCKTVSVRPIPLLSSLSAAHEITCYLH